MKKRSKFSALFLAAVLSVSITACGSSENDTKKNTTNQRFKMKNRTLKKMTLTHLLPQRKTWQMFPV